jgi:Sigma-70, region 4
MVINIDSVPNRRNRLMDQHGLSRLVGWLKEWLRHLSDLVEKWSAEGSVEAAIEGRERVQLIVETFKELPDRHVEAFILRYLGELRYREIAEGLQVTEGRARDLVFEARQKIQVKLVLPYLRVESHCDPENLVNLEVILHNDESLSVRDLKVKLCVGTDNLGEKTVRVRPHDSVIVKGFSSPTTFGAHQSLTVTLTVGRKEAVFTGLWPKPGLQSLTRKT